LVGTNIVVGGADVGDQLLELTLGQFEGRKDAAQFFVLSLRLLGVAAMLGSGGFRLFQLIAQIGEANACHLRIGAALGFFVTAGRGVFVLVLIVLVGSLAGAGGFLELRFGFGGKGFFRIGVEIAADHVTQPALFVHGAVIGLQHGLYGARVVGQCGHDIPQAFLDTLGADNLAF